MNIRKTILTSTLGLSILAAGGLLGHQAHAESLSVKNVDSISVLELKPSKNLLTSINKGQDVLDINYKPTKEKAIKKIDELNLKGDKEDFLKKVQKSKLTIDIDNIIEDAHTVSDKNSAEDKKVEDEKKEKERKEREEAEVKKAAEEAERKAEEERVQAEKDKEEKAKAEADKANSTESKTANASGLDMSARSGVVDIQALANYMSAEVGGDAGTWARIINAESTGRIEADNGSHYGLFQCDYGTTAPGASLGEQIEGARYKYNSQGFYNAWLRWEP